MARSQLSLPHIPALDGLRGLGVLGILLFHAGHLPGGWLGVDLFFVLSGFLITSLLLAEFEQTGRISLSGFWTRRARRLIPALLLALFGVSAYAALLAEPEALARIRADGFATLFYVANWNAILAGHDYWELFTAPSPLEHSWSLAIEEQFYLFWPPLALISLRMFNGSRRALGFWALFLAAASAIWMALLFEPEAGTARVYYGTDTRCLAPLAGAALAAAARARVDHWPGRGSLRGFDALGLLAMVVLAWAWSSLDGTDPRLYRGGLFALAIVASATIATVVFAPRGVTARLLEFAPLRGLGVISYGVYLWHWPLYLVLTEERTGLSDWALTGLRIAVSIGVATASYILLERPVRRGALTGTRALWLGLGSSAVLCVTLIGATSRQPDTATLDWPEGAGRVETLLVGDSVALLLAKSFEAEGATRGHATRTMAGIGCTQLRSDRLRLPSGTIAEFAACPELRERWRTWVVENAPRRVLLLDAWSGVGRREIAGGWYGACDPEYAEAYVRDLHETHEFLRRHDSESVLLIVPPPLTRDLSAALASEAGVAPASFDAMLRKAMECQNRVRRRVAREAGLPLLDLESWVCPAQVCVREMDGVVLRPDGLHFRDEGAEIASRWLLDQLERLR